MSITVDELDYEAETQSAAGPRPNPVDPPDARETSRGFGIELENVSPAVGRELNMRDTRGALVSSVDEDGPAFGRLLPRDVIVQVGSVPIATAADAGRELNRIPAGETALLRIVRDGERLFLTIRKQ